MLALLKLLVLVLQAASVLGEPCDPQGCFCASTPLISVQCNHAKLEVCTVQ